MAGPRTPHRGFNTKEAYAKWVGADAAAAHGSTTAASISKQLQQFMSIQQKTLNQFMIEMQKKDQERDKKHKKNKDQDKKVKKPKEKSEEDKEEDFAAQIHAKEWFRKHQRALKGTVLAKSRLLSKTKFSHEQQEIVNLIQEKLGMIRAISSQSQVDTEDVKKIKKLEASIARFEEVLPKSFNKEIEKLEKKQAKSKADNFDDYKNDMREFAGTIKGMIKDLGSRIADSFMGFADRIGIGALNVGNALRMVKLGGKAIAGAYRGAKWLGGAAISGVKHLLGKGNNLINKFTGSGDSEVTAEKEESILERIEKLFRIFVGTTVKSSEERKKTTGSFMMRLKKLRKGSGGLGIIGSMMNKAKTLATDGLSSLMKFLKSVPFLAVIGAGIAGWWVGSKIYKMFATEIQNGIEKVIDWSKTAWNWLKETLIPIKNWIDKFIGTPKKSESAIANAAAGEQRSVASMSAPQDVTKAARRDATGNIRNKMRGGGSQQVNFPNVTNPDWDPAGGSSTGQISKTIGQCVNPGLNADINGLDPSTKKNFLSMAQKYYEATGKKLDVNSAKRSSEDQARLYSMYKQGRGNPAAPPGKSLHEYGYAIDLNSGQVDELQKLGLLNDFGFQRLNIPEEKHHIQVAGVNVAAAKAGVYSAESTVERGNTGSSTANVAGNTVPVNQGFTPMTATTADADVGTEGSGASSGGGAGGMSAAVGVRDIPLFSSVDGSLLAMNVGAIVGS